MTKKELIVKWKRAMKLKDFACFNKCASYPNCTRLESQQYKRLIGIKIQLIKL